MDREALDRLEREWFGRLVLMTDRHDWTTAEIIGAYRSQAVVEGVFRTLKDPLRLALRPQYHWTDQKLHVHAFLCVVAYLLATLVHLTALRNCRPLNRLAPLSLETRETRGWQTALAEIGEKLHVATVLQGSVRKAGNRLHISAQLVSVTDGYHLWSERFDRELTDVFAVQDEIAAAIAAKLQVTFAQPVQPVGKATTAQEEAFELVAKGRALTAQRGGSLLAARECFERAILLSPDNADAHAAPGETLVSLVRYGLLPVSEGRPLAKAATRALEFEPTLAEAMGALASEATRAVAEDPLSLACAALHSIAL